MRRLVAAVVVLVAAAACGGSGTPAAYELPTPPEGYALCIVSGPVDGRELLFQLTYLPVAGPGSLTVLGVRSDGDEAEFAAVSTGPGEPNVVAGRPGGGVEVRIVSFTLEESELLRLATTLAPLADVPDAQCS